MLRLAKNSYNVKIRDLAWLRFLFVYVIVLSLQSSDNLNNYCLHCSLESYLFIFDHIFSCTAV